MSRVGKHIVNVPNGVNITFVNNTINIVKGNKEAKYAVPTCLDVKVSSDGILFTPIKKPHHKITDTISFICYTLILLLLQITY